MLPSQRHVPAKLLICILALVRHDSYCCAGLRKVKESFLPFWATSADVAVLLKGAQLGYDSWQPVYNPATRYYHWCSSMVEVQLPVAPCHCAVSPLAC